MRSMNQMFLHLEYKEVFYRLYSLHALSNVDPKDLLAIFYLNQYISYRLQSIAEMLIQANIFRKFYSFF
jgi:hypothetical protein